MLTGPSQNGTTIKRVPPNAGYIVTNTIIGVQSTSDPLGKQCGTG